MKQIIFATLCLLACSWGFGQQSSTSWSNEDFDFYAGDFNGDGYTDILFIAHSPNMPSGILLSDGTAPTILGQTWASNYLGIPWSSDAYTVIVADFNGDGKADILLQSNGPGDSYLLLTDASGHITAISQTISVQAMGLTWSADQHHLVAGDFSGDGKADLFFQPTAPGGTSAVVYADANGQFTSSNPVQTWEDGYLGLNWSVADANVYAGDFNGDGRADLLVQAQPISIGNPNAATDFEYPPNMNGVVLSAGGQQPFVLAGLQSWSRNGFGVDWSPLTSNVIIFDFNGDGRADVLLQPLDSGGAAYLLYGNAKGPIFSPAPASLATDIPINLSSVVLVPGNFSGVGGAGLLIQSATRNQGNFIAANITSGIHSHSLSLPNLSAATAPIATIGFPPGQSPAASTSAKNVQVPLQPLAGTVSPTSAGRTAGQFTITSTGAASYNVPLWTPPGARGVEPHLALHYTSGAPDGLLGPGWSVVGTSAIVRCGKTWASSSGAPSGVVLSTSDDICMDGVRLRLTSGSPLTAGATYQTEVADFSDVVAYGTQGNGPQYFIVLGKDGRYYEYGNTTDSRIFASGSTTPYAWALNKVRDRQQNNMAFTYVSGATIPTLAKIQYTATPGTSNAAPYEVDFNYVSRSGGTTITRYLAGYATSLTQQLDHVTMLASGTTVRKYQLGYAPSPTTTRPLLQSLQECGGSSGTDCIRPTAVTYLTGGAGWSTTPTSTGLSGQYGFIAVDLNGDGIADAIYGKLSGGNIHWYARLGTGSGYGAEIDTGANTNSGVTNIIPGNFSGTGRVQFLAPSGATWYVYTLNAAGTAFTNANTGVPTNGEYMAIDINGDGLPDLVSVINNGTAIAVRLNQTAPNGAVQFAKSSTTAWTEPTNLNGFGIRTPIGQYTFNGSVIADFNGDGRADILIHLVGSSNVITGTQEELIPLLSNGDGTFTAGTAFNVTHTWWGNAGTFSPQIVDWNGDGCSDVVADSGSSLTVFLSDCTGHFNGVPTGVESLTAFTVDWDGDGQPDLVYAGSNSLSLVRSTGAGVASPVSLNIPAPSTALFQAVDINGDGQSEILAIDSANNWAVNYYPHNGANTPPDLATTITDGFGLTFSANYVPITQSSYTKYSSATFPDIDFQGPIYVVNQFSASDGTGGTYTNSFLYYGAHLNLQGRGFEGFYSTRSQDSRNGVIQYSYYEQTFPYIGMIFQQDILASDAVTFIGSTVNTITSKTPGGVPGTSCNLCYFPYVAGSTVYKYEPAPNSGKSGGRGSYDAYTQTTFTYDSYGNLTDTKASTTDYDYSAPTSPFAGQVWITEVSNQITNDSSSNWCLGRPTLTTTTSTVPNQSAQSRAIGHTIDYANCRASVETIEPSSATLKVTNTFTFDACGNTSAVSVVGLDQNGNSMPQRVTKTSYGTRCQLPETITNAYNQVTTNGYNYNLGLKTSTQDPNKTTVSWTYDDFGRKTQETRPDATYTTYAYTDCVSSSCWGVSDLRFLVTTTMFTSTGSQFRQQQEFFDGMDRLRFDEANRVLGVWTTSVYTYDSLGRRAYYTLPYSTTSNGYHNYAYDVLNRLTADYLTDTAGNLYATTAITFSGDTSIWVNPNDFQVNKVTDAAGKLRQVTDVATNGGTTKYTFDPFGNIIAILDADSIQSTYTYNIRGFKTSASDADSGSWIFSPDSLNELVSQIDAKAQVTTFSYDLLGRMISRIEPESTTPTTWQFGTSASLYNVGRVIQVSKPDGYGEAYTYDSAGRPAGTTYTEDGVAYTFTYNYNTEGTVDTLTYPVSTSGYQFVLKSVYDSYGFLNQVKDNAAGTVFWQLQSANDSSLPTLETLGADANTLQVATNYTPWTNDLTLRTVGSGGSTTNLQNLTYDWTTASNLYQRIDNRQNLTEQFTYDQMYRLTGSTLNGQSNLTVSYTPSGNINVKSDVSSSPYVYDTVHKHAVKTAGSWSMTYDADGNMITRNGGTISWYSYNLPSNINFEGNSSAFSYNANHQRWKQVATYAGVTETTHYVGGLLEIVTFGSNPTEYRHQVAAGTGKAIYTRRTDGTSNTYYVTSDHIGSSDLVLDNLANVLTRESFTAYGARRGSNWTGIPSSSDYSAFAATTRKGFTSHEMIDSVSLVHMNGRVYDPYVGRFLSADSRIQNISATQSGNPYAYAWNGPLNHVDPSGHSLLGNIIGAIVSLAIIIEAPQLGLPAVVADGGAIAASSIPTLGIAGFVGGFVSGAISTGNLSGELTGGVLGTTSALAFAGAGTFASWAGSGGAQWSLGYGVGVLSHAAVGCELSMLSGGNCGKQALTAAIAEAASPIVSTIEGWGGLVTATLAAGVVGGLAARAVNDSFSDGFSIGASGYLFNQLVHEGKSWDYRTNELIDANNTDDTRSVQEKLLLLQNAIQDAAALLQKIGSNAFPGWPKAYSQSLELWLQQSIGDLRAAYSQLLSDFTNETAAVHYGSMMGAAITAAREETSVALEAISVGHFIFKLTGFGSVDNSTVLLLEFGPPNVPLGGPASWNVYRRVPQ